MAGPPEARGPSRKVQILMARRIREQREAEERRLAQRIDEIGLAGVYVLLQEARRHGHKSQNPHFERR